MSMIRIFIFGRPLLVINVIMLLQISLAENSCYWLKPGNCCGNYCRALLLPMGFFCLINMIRKHALVLLWDWACVCDGGSEVLVKQRPRWPWTVRVHNINPISVSSCAVCVYVCGYVRSVGLYEFKGKKVLFVKKLFNLLNRGLFLPK